MIQSFSQVTHWLTPTTRGIKACKCALTSNGPIYTPRSRLHINPAVWPGLWCTLLRRHWFGYVVCYLSSTDPLFNDNMNSCCVMYFIRYQLTRLPTSCLTSFKQALIFNYKIYIAFPYNLNANGKFCIQNCRVCWDTIGSKICKQKKTPLGKINGNETLRADCIKVKPAWIPCRQY